MNPADYLRELQTIEAELGAGRLRALGIRYEKALSRFSGFNQEFKDLTENPIRGIDYDEIIERTERYFMQCQSFTSMVEALPKDIASSQKMADFVEFIPQNMTIENVDNMILHLQKLEKEVARDIEIALEDKRSRELEQQKEEDRRKAEAQAEQARQAAKEKQAQLELGAIRKVNSVAN